MRAIPISQIATVNPAVVDAGGNPLSLNAVFLDSGLTTPVSSLLSFPSADSVADYYGTNSTQAALATNYFLGFDNSTKKPSTLFFGGYAAAARAAWLRGQSLAGMTLAQLQAVSGSLTISIDGTAFTAASLNLSAATSFTNAASLITTALVLTGSAAVTWDPLASRFVVTSGTTGATSTITQATGTAAAPLGLSAGILSQGVATDTPASAMDRVKSQEQNWATFTTMFEPNLADKTAFAVWANGQNHRYAYIAWDSDVGYKTTNNASVFGSVVNLLNYEGVAVFYGPDASIAAFVCGYAGSIDWAAINGRATAAFKSQSGLATSIDSLADATAVLSNNASYYGLYQAPGPDNVYSILYDGRMNGSKFRWLDTFLNQIYLNAQLGLSIFNGLKSVNAAPYNALGETYIRSWCAPPITEALNNGTIRIGVPLSESQKATIAGQAGFDISSSLENDGYYLQVLPATAQVRQQRQSPPVKLWYMDGGAIQQITLASIAVL